MNRHTLAHLTVFLCLAMATMGIFVATSRAELVWMPIPCGQGGAWFDTDWYSSIRDDAYPEPDPEPDNAYDTNARYPSRGPVNWTQPAMVPADQGASASYGCRPVWDEPVDPDLRQSVLPMTGVPGLILPGAGLVLLTGGWLLKRYKGKSHTS